MAMANEYASVVEEDRKNDERAKILFKRMEPDWIQWIDSEPQLRLISEKKARQNGDGVNICIVGPTGAGKSSLVNTLASCRYSALGRPLPTPRTDTLVHNATMDSNFEPNHVTRTFQTVYAGSTLIDTIGFKTEENGKLTYDGLWEHLLEGYIATNATLEMLRDAQEGKEDFEWLTRNHVIIVVRAMYENQSDEAFQKIIEARLKMDIPIPIIGVVTKVNLVPNIVEAFDNVDVAREYVKAAKVIDAPKSFPIESYTMFDRRANVITNLLALDILEEAVRLGKNYKLKKFPR